MSILNQTETVLQGVIADSAKEVLNQKLRGLCYCVEQPFCHREIVCKSIPIPGIAQTELRLRQNLLAESKLPKWTLRSIGTPMVKSKLPVTVRTVIEVAVSDNIQQFIELLGYKQDFEYVCEGTESLTMINNRKYSITVSKMKKDVNSGEFDPSVANTSFVELVTSCTDEDLNQVAEEMNSFAEYINVVDLAKVSHTSIKATKQAAPPPAKTAQVPPRNPASLTSMSPPSSSPMMNLPSSLAGLGIGFPSNIPKKTG
mmetsp:Transcript_38/g.36  ORF Transcript_38/g.36 Transcript_38/m.36 type:complete len:257 (-) Transcript_38:165-935(-)